MGEKFSFFKNALKDHNIGAILPSSVFARKKIDQMLAGPYEQILEYGPGNGVITRMLLAKVGAHGKVVAIEKNVNFIHELEKINDARLEVIPGDIIDILENKKIKKKSFDAIVSGIPFSFFPKIQRKKIIEKSIALTKSEGVIILYQTTPIMYPLLKKYCEHTTIGIVIRNFPPYFIMAGKLRPNSYKK